MTVRKKYTLQITFKKLLIHSPSVNKLTKIYSTADNERVLDLFERPLKQAFLKTTYKDIQK